MRKSVVLINFIRIPVPEKILFVRERVKNMTGNTNFPLPDVALAAITAAVDALEQKFLKAQGGGVKDTAAMHAAEDIVDALMRKLAAYVSRVADGDAVIIGSAGFSVTKTTPSQRNKPGKTEGLKLSRTDQPGTIVSNCKRMANVRGFVTVIASAPGVEIEVRGEHIIIPPSTAQIMIHVGAKRKAKHAGLVSGTKYYVRKYAFNTAGRGPDSDEISMVAG